MLRARFRPRVRVVVVIVVGVKGRARLVAVAAVLPPTTRREKDAAARLAAALEVGGWQHPSRYSHNLPAVPRPESVCFFLP